ncbi:unnamed protein product [Paramecium octaurelia]|uniref:Uncharacterized protein n=1 Tax=Paramecium octaurelia TaxID=43137 RepID=A0A8S1TY75_PAROT|nr:unnamed protein product [Paramecium octaurelia]
MRHFQKALGHYQKIYSNYPDNNECLRFLVQLFRKWDYFKKNMQGFKKIRMRNGMIKVYQGQNINLKNTKEEQIRLHQEDDNPVSFTNNTRRANKQPPPKTNVRSNLDDEQFKDGVEDNFLPSYNIYKSVLNSYQLFFLFWQYKKGRLNHTKANYYYYKTF